MNKISVFEHPEFGRIRTLILTGKYGFAPRTLPPRLAIPIHGMPSQGTVNQWASWFDAAEKVAI